MSEDIIAIVNANAEEARQNRANAAERAQNRRRARFEKVKDYIYAASICAGMGLLWLLTSALVNTVR